MVDQQRPPETWWEEVGRMKVENARFCENTAQRIIMLERWKSDQNGDIKEIKESQRVFQVSAQKWLVGLLTSVVLSLLLLVINLLVSLGRGAACL